ncbi:MAG TPA: NAD(P)H-binding protein [Streptosporangiaceae bacterium]
MILVTGATGNVGSEVVNALVEAGERVRALVRDPAKARLPAGAEPVAGDLNKPETFADALAGVSAVFLLPGYADLEGLLVRLRDAGAERVVLLSGASADSGDMSNAVSRYMILSERAVRDSGLPWTFVRSKAFMSNALRWVPQLATGDVVQVPFATVRTAAIDPYDIAAVVARALVSGEHAGRTYLVSGPQSLLPEDQVAVLAAVLGRDLRCEALNNEEARAEMEASMPVQYVDAFFNFYVDGALDESKVEPTVQEVTGRPPRTFDQWANAHADAFR